MGTNVETASMTIVNYSVNHSHVNKKALIWIDLKEGYPIFKMPFFMLNDCMQWHTKGIEEQ